MPDITKGKTFTSGETVTASEMNSLVDDAVINSSAITESKIAAGAVTNAKVAASAEIALDKLASGADGQIPICSATGVPAYVTLTGATVTNAGVVSLDADSVDSDQYVDGSIDTAHLSDDAVTAGKLADTAVSAGSYTAADITVDAQGRLTSAASGTAASVATGTLNPSANSTFTVTCGGGGDCLVVLNFQLKADFGSFGATTCEIRNSGGTTTLASGYGSTMEYDSRYSGNQVTVSYKSTGSSSGATVTLYAYLTGYTGNLEYIKGHYVGT